MVDIGWAFPMAAMNMKKGILKNIPGNAHKNDPNEDGYAANDGQKETDSLK